MGLISKARQLSVLCDVEVAVIVFSAGGKLYESCSGGTNSMQHLLARYEAQGRAIKGDGHDSCTKFRTCKQLLQTVDRLVEQNNTEELSVTDMTQLEVELNAALMQTRSLKTKLKMEYISTLQQQENNLIKENEETVPQIASVKHMYAGGDDGGGGLLFSIQEEKDEGKKEKRGEADQQSQHIRVE
ncbi:hypothetical protein L1887_23148 [Cichorium endivia]|nr:hypothetical protein L1887_23148 [Cichorium endivia]